MKFIKLALNERSALYQNIEFNEPDLQVLTSLLAKGSYYNIEWYLEWACTLNNEFSEISGNAIDLFFDKKKIIITYLWDSCSCDVEDCEKEGEQGHEIFKFETTKLNLIDTLCQWKAIVGEDPLKSELADIAPENIVIIQDDNNKIKIEVIDFQDIRFSRLINDNNRSWLKLIKSDIFENYFKVESNDELLYKLGIFLSNYELQKKCLNNWIDLNDKENNRIYLMGNLISLRRTEDIFSICNVDFKMHKDKFIKLGHKWEGLIKNSDLKEVEVIYENNEVKLIPKYHE